VLAFPPRALIHPGGPGTPLWEFASKNPDSSFDEYYRDEGQFTIPLSYVLPKSGMRALVIGTAMEKLLGGATFAHEAHHFLNICATPLGHLLHTARSTLCYGFVNTVAEFGKSADTIVMPFPFTRVPGHSVGGVSRGLIEHFITDFVDPFVGVHRCLLGRLEVSGPVSEAAAESRGVESLKSYYSVLDKLCGSRLSANLEHIEPGYPPFIEVASDHSHSELGGLQLAEFIAWNGEQLWLTLMGIYFGDRSDIRTEVAARIDRCHPDNVEHLKRYRIPLIVTRQFLGHNITLAQPMFASWMAMFAPIDPRSLHLVRKYKLGWADIHPGHRFIRILEVLQANNIRIQEDPFALRAIVDKYFDAVATILGWPTFDEMVSAMASRHPTEQSLLLNSFDDPYRTIYDQINSKRQGHPWCDMVPEREFHETPLQVPIVFSNGRVSVKNGKDGINGFMLFATARITDLLVFGECGPLVNALFSDESMQEPLRAVCDRVGLSWIQVRDAWHGLRGA